MIFVKEILCRTREDDREREGEKNVSPTPEHEKMQEREIYV